MKLPNNWRHKSLESLGRKHIVKPPDDESRLVRRVYELCKTPLNEFSIEDLRLMIGQEIGLDFLIPIALDHLYADLFAEGDLYPGDLLGMVLLVDRSFWVKNKSYWIILQNLIIGRESELKANYVDFSKFPVQL